MSDLHRAALHSAVSETRTRDLSITSPTFYHKIVPENDAESVFTKAAKTASDVFCRLQLFCQKRSDVKQRESKLLQLFRVPRCRSVLFQLCFLCVAVTGSRVFLIMFLIFTTLLTIMHVCQYLCPRGTELNVNL